ncbi:MAG: hypothetical protein KAR14_03665, partial [Candidatus Aminicenantes bacterium]|nr:hypothetical protein [Candidatus Aminicenantes bacterium]
SKFVFFSIWLKNDHISNPVNFTDIEYFKVHYIDEFTIKDNIPENSLFTSYERDLYFEPDN